MPRSATFLYLHGFASGPQSRKAQFFRTRLADAGIALTIPDLAPDFTYMTVTSMLAVVEGLLPPAGPVVLMGSSLGGYLAALVASRHPEKTEGLVLLAPAFGFIQRWEERVDPRAMARWREKGTARTFHYALGREVPLHYGLLDDGRQYPEEPDPPAPALVLAGRLDQSVPLPGIERFAARRPGRRLVVYDAGHELTEVLDPMWEETQTFLRGLGFLA